MDNATIDYDKLIDPGECDHPRAMLEYCGMQDFGPNFSKLALHTCRKCGSTKTLKGFSR